MDPSSSLITDLEEYSTCHLGRSRPHQRFILFKGRARRTERLASPLELAVVVRQKLVKIELP